MFDQGSGVTVRQVAVTLGVPEDDLTETDQSQITDWVGKTERIIRKRLGSLERLNQEDLQDVVSEVVARRFKNPDGKQNERLDDYGYGLDKETAKNRLYLTEEEWEQLTPNAASRGVSVTQVVGSPGPGPTPSASGASLRGWWS
nr:MAG TPA_asm: hypothetical protein [Caudoviricetes sp.]